MCLTTRLEYVRYLLDFEGCFTVDAIGHSGGLAILWKNYDMGMILSFNNSFIDMKVSFESFPEFGLTGFYGDPN